MTAPREARAAAGRRRWGGNWPTGGAILGNKKGIAPAGGNAFFKFWNGRLDHRDVDCRGAFLALLDLEAHAVAFIQRPETARIDGGMMNKHVRTVFLFDETKPLAVVKPLYYAFCHGDFLLVKKNSLSFRLQVATLANGFFTFSKKPARRNSESLLSIFNTMF
jgi:hypothetical protein